MTDSTPTDAELAKKAKTCMIIGLISLCGGFLLGPIMLPVTIFGIIAGAKSYKCSKKNFAITGLVTGLVATVVVVYLECPRGTGLLYFCVFLSVPSCRPCSVGLVSFVPPVDLPLLLCSLLGGHGHSQPTDLLWPSITYGLPPLTGVDWWW